VIAGLAQLWAMEREAVADLVWSTFVRALTVERRGQHDNAGTE